MNLLFRYKMSTGIRPLLLLMAILAIACGSTLPAPSSTPPPALPELKYSVIDKVGSPFVCGPPVAFQDYDQQQAAADFPGIKADAVTYRAIIAHAHPAGDEASPAYQVAVWQEWRRLAATQLVANGHGGYDFNLRTATAIVAGSVDGAGVVTVSSTRPGRPNCPICLTAATLIETPAGPVRVTELKVGEAVWTASADGHRVEARIVQLGSTAFPLGHDAILLKLADGRSLTASAGHPLADGRLLGDLRAGDHVDGTTVLAATALHLGGGATYDLLPSGPTGSYWAGGIPLRSTLFTPSWDH